MKEIKSEDKIYLDKYDVNVNPYLTLYQIQQIVNAVTKFDTYAEREENKNILMLYHATDMTKKDIESMTYELMQQSGLIEDVAAAIKNYNEIDKAIQWTESIGRSLNQIAGEIHKMMHLNEVNRNGSKTKK